MLTRKIQLRIYLSINLIVFSVLFGISIQHASFGKEFLLTAPGVFKNTPETVNSSVITFFMVTLAANGTQISITIPEFEHTNQSLNHTVNLNARETLSFSPDDEFKYIDDKSQIWCFRFTANEAFSITVSTRFHSFAFYTFQAVPTEWWGKKYLVFTLNGKPFIQVISNTDNNVVTMYLNLRSVLLDPDRREDSESHTDSLKFNDTLQKWQAITLSNCVTRSSLSGMKTFVGSVMVGQSPIGVISGNCNGSTFTYSCEPDSRRRLAGHTTDIATEMLLPVAAHGKEFVVVYISRKTPSAAVIMASKEDTTVNISTSTGVMPVTVLNTTRWSYSFEVTENRKVVSSRRIQVVIMSLSTCLGPGASNDEGGPAISLILPNSFFYSEFFWSPPEELGSHYATVVMTLDHVKHVHVNGAPLRHYDVENVLGYPKYQVSTFSLLENHNHITTPSQFKFACYVYGMGPTVQYMHPAGFEGCEDTVDAMFPGDLIDNDCDGKIGEEIRNGVDDDGDGRIDEDILHSDDEDGMWGEWQPWTCNPNCSRPIFFRMRQCDSPPPSGRGHDCDGEPLIMKNVRCKPVGIDCPRRCASFAWGSQCERSCAHCGKDCDTETGWCDFCKSGYKHRESGCEHECEVNEYGVDCAFICTEKCNADCEDRVTGECPKLSRFLILFMFMLVVLLGLLMFSIRRRTPRMKTVTVHHEGSLDRQRNVVIHHINRKESRFKKTGRTGAIVIAPHPP